MIVVSAKKAPYYRHTNFQSWYFKNKLNFTIRHCVSKLFGSAIIVIFHWYPLTTNYLKLDRTFVECCFKNNNYFRKWQIILVYKIWIHVQRSTFYDQHFKQLLRYCETLTNIRKEQEIQTHPRSKQLWTLLLFCLFCKYNIH